MVLYTPDAATALGSENAAQAKAGAWIANLNTCLSNSSLGITASLAHTQQVTQNFGQNGHSQALQYLGSDTTVTSLRDTHKADLVNIMIQGAANGAGTVGLGHVLMSSNGSPNSSCTSVWHSGQDETFSHEIGHNHGCGHDATQGGSKLNAAACSAVTSCVPITGRSVAVVSFLAIYLYLLNCEATPPHSYILSNSNEKVHKKVHSE